MDTIFAMMMGTMNRGKERMVFDWDKAARLIAEEKPEYADAYLAGDRGYTGGCIYDNGEIIDDDYTYLASTWAIPMLEMDGKSVECYKMKHEVPEWDSDTKWPDSARRILHGEDK